MTAAIPTGATVIKPQPGPQTQFLKSAADVIFYGGSAGGGKTYALLLDPLYHVDNPKFGAVIFRRETTQITKQGSLWDTAVELYVPLGAIPKQSPHHHFLWPSGAKINLHHMQLERDKLSWQGSQVDHFGFDEVTHFEWSQFNYIFSRLRSGSGVAGKVRATCNPDPDSWVRSFIDWWIDDDGFAVPERSGVIRWLSIVGEDFHWADSSQELLDKYPEVIPKSITFIRSSLEDNKILMEQDPSYLSNLHMLTRVERARLLHGNWDVRPAAGAYFQRGEFQVVDKAPNAARRVRAWDLAATRDMLEPMEKKRRKVDDPDYTAGVLMAEHNGIFYVEHVERFRSDPPEVKQRMKNIGNQDGQHVTVRFPQDPGQAGKSQARDLASFFAGWPVSYKTVSGSKEHRATPFASQVQAGNVRIVKGKWNEAFLSELENFPEGLHDDQVDAASDAFDQLTNDTRAGVW
jgi:predicted phage terminase large subunit-like protein